MMTDQTRKHRADERKLERREYFLAGLAFGAVGMAILCRVVALLG